MTAQTYNSTGLTDQSTSSSGRKGEQDVNLENESVAGEEDPGASLDMSSGSAPASKPLNPGDDAPAGTPGTGENICRECGGSGRLEGGAQCKACGGSGKVNVGVGGG